MAPRSLPLRDYTRPQGQVSPESHSVEGQENCPLLLPAFRVTISAASDVPPATSQEDSCGSTGPPQPCHQPGVSLRSHPSGATGGPLSSAAGCLQRMEQDPYLPPYTRINSKCPEDLNLEAETTKLLEENVQGKLHNLRLDSDFSDVS